MTLPFDLRSIDLTGLLSPTVVWALASALLLAAVHAGCRISLARRAGNFRWLETLRFLETDGLRILTAGAWDVIAGGIESEGGRYVAVGVVIALIVRLEAMLLLAIRQDVADLFGRAPAGAPSSGQ